MDKINWTNGQTPLNQTNLNQMQTNVETALNEVLANNSVVVSPTEPSTGRNKVWLQHNKKNMLNLRITNATIGPQGQSITDNASTRLCFDYIEVKSNLEITFSANTSTDFMGLAFYDSSRTFLSREYANGASQITRTTPSNTKYVKPFIQISSATMNSSSVNQYGMQLENGSQRTTVEAIVEDKAYILNSNNIYEEFKPQIEWKENGYGDKFRIIPDFNGSGSSNKLLIQSTTGAEGTDPTNWKTLVAIHADTGDIDYENDTGWIDMSLYVNTNYFSARPGMVPEVRKIGNIVYWRGEVYCKTSITYEHSIEILSNIPVQFTPSYQFSGAGCRFQTSDVYNIFIDETRYIRVDNIDKVFPIMEQISGFQLSNISGYPIA